MPLTAFDHPSIIPHHGNSSEMDGAWYGGGAGPGIVGGRPPFAFDGAWLSTWGRRAVIHLWFVCPPTPVRRARRAGVSGADFRLSPPPRGWPTSGRELTEKGVTYTIDTGAGGGFSRCCKINLNDPEGNHIHIDSTPAEAEAALIRLGGARVGALNGWRMMRNGSLPFSRPSRRRPATAWEFTATPGLHAVLNDAVRALSWELTYDPGPGSCHRDHALGVGGRLAEGGGLRSDASFEGGRGGTVPGTHPTHGPPCLSGRPGPLTVSDRRASGNVHSTGWSSTRPAPGLHRGRGSLSRRNWKAPRRRCRRLPGLPSLRGLA